MTEAAVQLRVAMAQIDLLVGDIEGNTDQVIDFVRQAEEQQADLVVFPELTLTGYPPEDLLLRSGLYRRVEQALQRLCHEITGEIAVLVGYPRRQEGACFNMAGLIRHGVIEAEYRKQVLPNYSVFDEKRYFESGSGPCIVQLNDIAIGITICEDAWQLGPMQQAADHGAQLLVNLNASPYHVRKASEREQVIRERVDKAGIPVVYVNLLGGQDELVFDGASFVVDANGGISFRAPAFTEGLYAVEFALQDGRVQPLAGTCEAPMPEVASVYHALVLGVRDYINKNRFQGAVIGLSGGIDSAVTLAIAVAALGAERVEAVTMPSRYTADMSVEDALQEADNLGIDCRVIPIEPIFNAFLDSLADEFAGRAADTTEENIQARCRGVILMAISNKKGKMVLSTGNKSEMSVGYATLYGDMVGGFCALKDVPKTLVYQLAEYINREHEIIPQRVITRPPSAELAPDQKDEDSLPPYDTLDRILEDYIERDLCAEDIIEAGFEADTVYRVIRMVDQNEYKRRQAPPGVKITRRAFGRDRRYPITSAFGRYGRE